MDFNELLNTKSSRSDASLLGDCTAEERIEIGNDLGYWWRKRGFSTERERALWEMLKGDPEDVPPLRSELPQEEE